VTRELYDIWEEDSVTKLQLVNFVANFKDQPAAERFADAVRKYRASQVPTEPAKKGTK